MILYIILFFHYGKPEGPDIDQSSPIIDTKMRKSDLMFYLIDK